VTRLYVFSRSFVRRRALAPLVAAALVCAGCQAPGSDLSSDNATESNAKTHFENADLITGESLTLGTHHKDFTFAADLGDIDPLTKTYTAPFLDENKTDRLRVTDKHGRKVGSIDIHIRTFELKDSYFPLGTSNSAGNSFAVDDQSAVYVAGWEWQSLLGPVWVVRKSIDRGDTWATVDSFQQVAGGSSWQTTIAFDYSRGNLYVGGQVCLAPAGGGCNSLAATVRRSSDRGLNWTTAQTWPATGVNGITVDKNGNVYAALTGVTRPLRKSVDGGSTWSEVDVGSDAEIFAMASDSWGGVIVVARPPSSVGWIVKRSSDAGATWNTLDLYVPNAGDTDLARSVAVDALGNVFISGFEYENVVGTTYPPSNWIVRRGSIDGTGWKTLDMNDGNRDFGQNAAAVTVGPDGTVYVAGRSDGRWEIRKSTDHGDSWTTIGRFNGVIAHAIAAPDQGSVYVTGRGSPGWQTRVLSKSHRSHN
jgi:hypothetical protein